MSNNTRPSSHYQVALFLRSPDSEQYNLDAHDRIILRVIADYIDMSKGECIRTQIALAKECGLSRRQFQIKSELLVSHKFLFRYSKWKMQKYILGEFFTKLSTVSGASHALDT